MLDAETRVLDEEILGFIQKHRKAPSRDADFEALAFKVHAYQFRRSGQYRRFCLLEDERPEEIRSWKEIPAMPAVGFRELVLTTFPVREAVRVFKTSGTTGAGLAPPVKGEPLSGESRAGRGAHFFDTLDLYEASLLSSFEEFLRPGQGEFAFFFLMVSSREDPHSSLAHMMGAVNLHFGKGRPGAFYVRKGELESERLAEDLRSAAREKRKAFVLSTAFSLKAFLDLLKEKKLSIKLPAGSRLMETGGFKGKVQAVSKERLYAECGERLGIRKGFCAGEYGMTELSSQFYDARGRGVFKGPGWTRTLVIDPRTGKEARKGGRGILRHFDLANRGSVMAVQTEDLGQVSGGGFRLFGRSPGADLRGCSLTYEEFLS